MFVFRVESVEVVYVCGKDHALRCRLYRDHLPFKVVCISRDTDTNGSLSTTNTLLFANREALDFDDADGERNQKLLHQASSTAVRDAFARGEQESVKEIVHPDVWRYLCDNHLC